MIVIVHYDWHCYNDVSRLRNHGSRLVNYSATEININISPALFYRSNIYHDCIAIQTNCFKAKSYLVTKCTLNTCSR